MSLTSKPKPLQDNKAALQFIEGGGSVPTSAADKKGVRFSLTIPHDICEQIDRIRLASPVKISRHLWVLNAIVAALEQENKP